MIVHQAEELVRRSVLDLFLWSGPRRQSRRQFGAWREVEVDTSLVQFQIRWLRDEPLARCPACHLGIIPLLACPAIRVPRGLLLRSGVQRQSLLVEMHILLWARTEIFRALVRVVRHLCLAHLLADLAHEGPAQLAP